MTGIFNTSGEFNIELLYEIRKYLIIPRRKLIYFLICAAVLGMSAFSISVGATRTGGTYLLCFALLLILYRAQLNRAVKMNMRRITDAGTDRFSYTTSFEQDMVKTVNHTTGAETAVRYEDVVRVAESRSVIVIFARSGQFLLAFKNQLSEQQLGELKNFLRSRLFRKH